MNQDLQDTMENADQGISERFSDKLKTFQESAAEWQKRATDTTRKAAQATDEYVHQNPWTAVATVGAVCFFLGFLVGRCRD